MVSNNNYYPYSFLCTNDGGISWHEKKIKNIDLLSPFINTIVSFTDELHGFFLGQRNDLYIFSTADGGNSWKQDATISPYFSASSYNNSHGNWFFIDSLHGTLVGYGGMEKDYNTVNDMILQTNDGGNTWKQRNDSLSGTWNILHGICFTDSLNGTIVGENTYGAVILHTTDAGNTWTEQKNILNSNISLTNVSFSDTMHGTIVGRDKSNYPLIKGIILHTTNAGITWNQQNSGIILQTDNALFEDVAFGDSLNGLIVGRTELFLKLLMVEKLGIECKVVQTIT